MDEAFFNETLPLMQQARCIHVWNNISKDKLIKKGSNTIYEHVVKQVCPRVYALLGDIF